MGERPTGMAGHGMAAVPRGMTRPVAQEGLEASARAPQPGAESADLLDYELLRHRAGFVVRSAARHKLLWVVSFLAVAGLGMGSLWVVPMRYQVGAVILAQRNPVMSTLSNPELQRPFDWDTPTRAARETVLRRDNLVSLCKQVGFVDKYLERRPPVLKLRDWVASQISSKPRTRDDLLDDLVDTLETRLWVEVRDGTVSITFQWWDKEIAYQMVEAALESFLEARHVSELAVMSEAVSILEGHAATVHAQVDETMRLLEGKERVLRRVAPRKVAASPAAPVPVDDAITRVRATLATRRRAVADLEEFRQKRLAELQATLVQLQAVYSDRHPAVVTARQNIEEISGPSPQIQALRNEIADLERELLRRGGQAAEPAAAVATPVELPRNELAEAYLARPEAETPRLEYERGQLRLLFRQYSNLVERISAARMEMDTSKAAFKYRYSIITPPQIPKKPHSPNAVLLVVGALVGGILFAFFATAAIDVRSGRLIEGWQIERQLEMALIAEIRL